LRLLCQCLFDVVQGASLIAALAGQHAQQVVGIGILRPALQHLPVELLSAG
jgi:hypothetical protein